MVILISFNKNSSPKSLLLDEETTEKLIQDRYCNVLVIPPTRQAALYLNDLPTFTQGGSAVYF